MNSHNKTKQILTTMLAGILVLIAAPSLKAADVDSPQLSEQLSQAKQEAIRLREDAHQMEDFVRKQVTWDTHNDYATKVAQDVVAMREKVDKLDKVRSTGSAWQKTAIDQIKPLMNEMASSTTSVIETLNTRPFDKTEYNEYLEANYDEATHLAALISDFVDYGKNKTRLEKAAEKLKSAPKAK